MPGDHDMHDEIIPGVCGPRKAFPVEALTRLLADAKVLLSGQAIASVQVAYCCALEGLSWGGNFVPGGPSTAKHPMQAATDDECCAALQTAIDAHKSGSEDGMRAVNWLLIVQIALRVLDLLREYIG